MHRVYQRSQAFGICVVKMRSQQVRGKMQTFLGDIHELTQGGSVIPGYEAAPGNWIRMCRRWIAISASFYSQRSVTRTWSSSRDRLRGRLHPAIGEERNGQDGKGYQTQQQQYHQR